MGLLNHIQQRSFNLVVLLYSLLLHVEDLWYFIFSTSSWSISSYSSTHSDPKCFFHLYSLMLTIVISNGTVECSGVSSSGSIFLCSSLLVLGHLFFDSFLLLSSNIDQPVIISSFFYKIYVFCDDSSLVFLSLPSLT